MHVHSFPYGGGAFTGHADNNAGFLWSYQAGMQWSNGQDEAPVIWPRRLELQTMVAGQCSQPVPAAIDDFGTVVVVGA